MQQVYDKINETARIIQSYITEHTPEFAIILGSGLSKLENEVEVISEIKYQTFLSLPYLVIKVNLFMGK